MGVNWPELFGRSEADELSLHELFSSQAAVADIRLVRHETVCFGPLGSRPQPATWTC